MRHNQDLSNEPLSLNRRPLRSDLRRHGSAARARNVQSSREVRDGGQRALGNDARFNQETRCDEGEGRHGQECWIDNEEAYGEGIGDGLEKAGGSDVGHGHAEVSGKGFRNGDGKPTAKDSGAMKKPPR